VGNRPQIDFVSVVKRGCAVEDKRYSGTGCEEQISTPGADVMIFLIFSPKNSAKKLAFFTQNKAK
jgi:hypothetical protein